MRAVLTFQASLNTIRVESWLNAERYNRVAVVKSLPTTRKLLASKYVVHNMKRSAFTKKPEINLGRRLEIHC